MTQRTRPVLVPALTDVVSVAVGDIHSLALTSDGRVLSWGNNASGQLGLGSTTGQVVPTEITALSTVVAIAAGNSHSLAVTASGALYAWGANGSSRLGDGTTTMRTSPVLISVSNVVAVAAGLAHSIALTGNGSVYVWGLGTSGQLGQASTSSSTTPIVISGLQASAIAAGNNHSAAIRSDGTLVVWGANASGQVGDGTTTIRTQPSAVAGLSSISTLTLGDLHSAAVTSDGDVWTWGEAGSGQVGDNGTTDRSSPVSVIADVPRWAAAAPTLNLASGTLAAPQIVTIGSPVSGATLRYTLTGADPTDADPEVPATGELSVDFSTMLRARAFLTGRVPGRVARADYVLQSAAPSISPGTGTYATAQTVTLAVAGPPTAIRYTLDGSDPAATSPLYTSPFVVGTGLVIKAQSFPSNGWTPSAVTSATLSFNYGVLGAPAASPAGGVYQPTQAIALTAASGATIRYTTDGSDPSAVSNQYVGPLSFSAGVTTLKAKAFHPDWTESPTASETFTLDGTPPTIRAGTFPYDVGGWFSAPVTVSFTCVDAVGVAGCTPPMTVSQEGTTVVSGTATDLAGNTTSVSVTVNLDTTPPEVALTSPTGDVTTTATTIEMTGSVSDVGSGVSVASCNGVPITPTNGVVTCTVPLRPGRNSVVLVARDAAGNTVSTGVRATRTGTPTMLTIAPGTRTLLVDEAASLSLSDDFGVSVAGATWEASDPTVASLSSDDPPVVTALTAGSTTITATKNGLSTIATITVVAGTSLPEGTTRWSVAPTPGLEMTSPIYTHVVDETVPDLFTVEADSTGDVFTMRALSASGEQKWVEAAPGLPVMGDSFGGVVTFTPDGDGTPAGLAHVGGPATAPPWRYDPTGAVGRPAQASDGTIYAIEKTWSAGYAFPDLAAIVINGHTGRLVARVPLPRDFVEFTAVWEGQIINGIPCNSGFGETPPHATDPVVGTDGAAYFQFRRITRVDHGYCDQPDISRVDHRSVQSVKVTPSGAATFTTLYEFTGPYTPWGPEMGQTVPDGLGGILATWSRHEVSGPEEATLTRLAADGTRLDLPGESTVLMTGDTGPLVGDAGTAYVYRNELLEALDVATLTSKWTTPWAGYPVMALDGGGVALHDLTTGVVTTHDATGTTIGASPLFVTSPTQVKFGIWTGTAPLGPVGETGLVAQRTVPLNQSPVSYASAGGNPLGQSALRLNGYSTIDEAARSALDFIYDITSVTGWEWGGVVCPRAGRYWWSRVVTNQDNGQVITIDSPGLTAEQRATLPQCGSYGGASQPVATFHTHVTGAAGQLYPSGYIAGAIAPNDLNNAAQRPDLQFFLKTHGMTPGTTSTFRYQAEPLPDGSGNIVWTAYYNTFKWINGQWQLFSYPQ